MFQDRYLSIKSLRLFTVIKHCESALGGHDDDMVVMMKQVMVIMIMMKQVVMMMMKVLMVIMMQLLMVIMMQQMV